MRGLTVNGVEVTFDYDSDGLLTRAGSLSLEPDPDHGLLRSTHLNSVSTGNDYSVFGELSHHQATVNGAMLYSTDFQRDALGRITAKSETIEGDTHNHRYHYDEAGRLARVEKDGNTTDTYQYDANGNRLSHNGTSATYDEQDRLLSYGEKNYNYTEAGELTSWTENGRTTTFDYDVMGNLRKVQLPDDTSISYKIDGRNRRIGKRVNGELVQGFLYQGQLNPVAELDGNSNVVSRFVYGDKRNVPAYMIKNNTNYRIVSDHLGSVRLVVNAQTGEVAQRMDYDAWGNVTQDTNPGFQPFGYAGGIYDHDTGLTRFGARDYDPEVGRWQTKDPIGFRGGLNLYAYVGNDPVNLIDPEGNLPSLPQWAVDGSAAFGDTISFGLTDKVRDWMGTNSVVNKDSAAYTTGEVAGIAYGFAAGGAGLARAGLRIERGNWKQAGQWVAAKGQKKWHFHYGTAPGLTKHHLPYQFSNWLRNFKSAYKNGTAWNDILSTLFSGYGFGVAGYGLGNCR